MSKRKCVSCHGDLRRRIAFSMENLPLIILYLVFTAVTVSAFFRSMAMGMPLLAVGLIVLQLVGLRLLRRLSEYEIRCKDCGKVQR